MRKLLFFDIDGTLLTEGENRYIPESAKKAIDELQDRGHLCFINTGRAICELHNDILSLGFDGFVCGCGTYVQYHDQVLLHHEMPMDLANAILASLNRNKVEWLLEGRNSIYYSKGNYTTHIADFHDEYHRNFPNVEDVDPDSTNLDFDKFCACTTKDSNWAAVTEEFKNDLTFIDRGNDFYEVIPKGDSKASGMEFLMEYFHVIQKDTYAFGDSTNDLPMLEYAGTSIGMGNSDSQVVDIADYITDTVENDGIYKALKHFNLI